MCIFVSKKKACPQSFGQFCGSGMTYNKRLAEPVQFSECMPVFNSINSTFDESSKQNDIGYAFRRRRIANTDPIDNAATALGAGTASNAKLSTMNVLSL